MVAWHLWPLGPRHLVNTARHLTTRQQKRTHLLRTIDANDFNWQIWAVASSGFFTDSYNLFAINVIYPSIAYVYWPNESTGVHESNINIITLAGSLLGQLVFGYLADRYGRTRMYGFELLLVIFSTIGVATSSSGTDGSMSFIALLYCWRFVTGVGIGAEYPLSAVITAEWAPVKSRARMMAAVFLMQPVGQLMAQLVGIWVLLGLNNRYQFQDRTDLDYCRPIVDKLWRWVAGVGAIPCIFAIAFRWTITDPDYHYGRLQDIELSDAEGLDGTVIEVDEPLPIQFSWDDIKQYFIIEGNWHYLAGTSICWFILDFAFYGLSVNSPRNIATLWSQSDTVLNIPIPDWISDPSSVNSSSSANSSSSVVPSYPAIYQVLMQNGKQSILTVSIGSLIGSLIIIKTINYFPRKTIFAWSFLLVAVLLLITGGTYLATFQTGQHAITIVLYGLCQLFFNLGPNTLAFIIPAEIFPTRYRCTCHGISAAAGKLSAVLVQTMISHISIDGLRIKSPGGNRLGYVLILFSFVMASGYIFAWAWIPELQDARVPQGYELPNKTLEELAKGKIGVTEGGEVIGFRAKLRELRL
ncbi:hypothetical protein Egran_04750 [Elaphomyces granulatus]|uniref:Major facilitator superfamily (MFS) profile domain-containing protein n=1 Tax=Elaphomyces granulatus TaxID=519963 RepID=A0A232LTJ9_9EURO|nr:hypothetical protein Egran_04750 [Elaphomyces granulatus]